MQGVDVRTTRGLNQLWLSALWGVALCVSAGWVESDVLLQPTAPSIFNLPSFSSISSPAATANMSGGFFGFDTALPEHRQAADRPNDAADTSKFQNASSLLNPFNLEAPEDEEMEVYTWGQGLDKDVEAADELNDATFGVDVNAISE